MTENEIVADLLSRTIDVVDDRVGITLGSGGLVDFTVDDAVDAVEAGLPEDYPTVTGPMFPTRRDLIAHMVEQVIADMIEQVIAVKVDGGDAA